MFQLKGRGRIAEPTNAGKNVLKPALYDPPGAPAGRVAVTVPRASPLAAPPARERAPVPTPALGDEAAAAVVPPSDIAARSSNPADAPVSTLSVGIGIKLKGVEISDCDMLAIEGDVEATVHSKTMQIAGPGTLQGKALVDIAEIHGTFSGELTARKRLVVHGTGRVSGTIRYGQLIVSEGGALTGDVQRLESAEKLASPSRNPAPDG